MNLNCNFDSRLENIINSYSPLAKWFEKNQEKMAYFGLTHAGCLHFEDNPMINNDIQILGKMANASLSWLENYELTISDKEKAINAAQSIADIYNQDKEKLSDVAKKQYYINLEIIKEKVMVKKI